MSPSHRQGALCNPIIYGAASHSGGDPGRGLELRSQRPAVEVGAVLVRTKGGGDPAGPDALGIKNIKIGPLLPAFVTPNVLKFLVQNFNIQPISTAEQDLKQILG